MSYLVLARKWRPKTLDELIGQETISRILKNAIQQSRVAHAYLFSGPRGVGKTSTARILAKSLNCAEGPTVAPCGECPSCVSITEGHSVDVMEIDGASNNSVDDIRNLREGVKYAPSSGRYKVYIIDEVHMLSQSAFNALLKTLEEPPAHVVFVLATTSPHKVPVTVLSRCQHLSFRRISPDIMRKHIKRIAEVEGINITEQAVDMIVRAADGGMRDALTLMDQIHSFSQDITEKEVRDILGLSDMEMVVRVCEALLKGDRRGLLRLVETLYESGTDFRAFMKDLLEFIRNLLVAKITGSALPELSEIERRFLGKAVRDTTEEEISLILSEMIRTEAEVRTSFSPRIALEMGLIRASLLSNLRPVGEIINRLREFESLGSAFQSASEPTAAETGGKESAEISGVTGSAELQAEQSEREPSVAEPLPGEPERENLPEDLWSRILSRIDDSDPVVASKLAHAKAEIAEGRLTLEFNGGHRLFAETLKKDIKRLYSLVMEIDEAKKAGIKSIDITAAEKKKSKAASRKSNKTELTPEEIKVIETFGGRIIERRKTDV